MSLDVHAAMIAEWLCGVHVPTAATRIIALQATYLADDPAPVASPVAMDRAAGHEAAHAVIAQALGLRVLSATLRADATGAVAYTAATGAPEGALMTVIADLAGVAYELLADADKNRQFHLAHSHDILAARIRVDKLRSAAPGFCPSAESLARLALVSVAANLITIRRLARVLLAVGKLDGAEVAAVRRRPQ